MSEALLIKRGAAKLRLPISADITIGNLRDLAQSPDPITRVQVADFFRRSDMQDTGFNPVSRDILRSLTYDKDRDVRDAANESMMAVLERAASKAEEGRKD